VFPELKISFEIFKSRNFQHFPAGWKNSFTEQRYSPRAFFMQFWPNLIGQKFPSSLTVTQDAIKY